MTLLFSRPLIRCAFCFACSLSVLAPLHLSLRLSFLSFCPSSPLFLPPFLCFRHVVFFLIRPPPSPILHESVCAVLIPPPIGRCPFRLYVIPILASMVLPAWLFSPSAFVFPPWPPLNSPSIPRYMPRRPVPLTSFASLPPLLVSRCPVAVPCVLFSPLFLRLPPSAFCPLSFPLFRGWPLPSCRLRSRPSFGDFRLFALVLSVPGHFPVFFRLWAALDCVLLGF